ncbi:MAG: alanine racemase [Thermoflexales bacterium]|nr:alanine racemase [Thermoflexales bacterium]
MSAVPSGQGRPTEARIDLGALRHNAAALAARAGVPLMAVVKANGYGHGAVLAAKAALAGGARWLGVATAGEALQLRAAGLHAPTLVLGWCEADNAAALVEHDIACTIAEVGIAEGLAARAAAQGGRVAVHLKVDTGMNRLGVRPEDALDALQRLRALPGLRLEGLYTHFATADAADERDTRAQLAAFNAVVAATAAAGLRPTWVHASNSAATLRHPAARFDLVRCGIALYGIDPDVETPAPPELRPALSLVTRVTQVKTIPAGAAVSYGGRWRATRPSRIATLPIGYADGLRRVPAWREVLLRGRRAPIVGRICMDYCMVDVTELPDAQTGDEVVLLGSQGNERIRIEDVAGWLGTIPYEVACALGGRVPRVAA